MRFILLVTRSSEVVGLAMSEGIVVSALIVIGPGFSRYITSESVGWLNCVLTRFRCTFDAAKIYPSPFGST